MNRLGSETSPYLLQHKDNPVHWWAWGPAALAEAKRTGKPILLSVGYAACHWCHVMAHESFEDNTSAAVMNELFVNIKVDREERPDIDAIYMSALHQLGQQGGWPLTMFLDGDARPFWGGTYFPKTPHYGRPAFTDVLRQISNTYKTAPEKIGKAAAELIEAVSKRPANTMDIEISDDMIADLIPRLARIVDRKRGGIDGAPKFPQWNFFWLLWRGAIRYQDANAKHAVEVTLANICQGGIYDHLAGGFARYSVDDRWLAPHFEKMLYDNALLLDLMTEVWRETRNPLFEVRIAETVSWLESEMIADGGGFAASLDADSEGEEGKFYVWTKAEIDALLGGDDAQVFCEAYDVAADGNWEGHTILNRLHTLELGDAAHEAQLERLRAKLLARRTSRIRPGWDDKVLADWNGLMTGALARAAIVFDKPNWLSLARTAFGFVETKMVRDGRLQHSARLGRTTAPGTASDYANMIFAALRLHQATGDEAFLNTALAWTETLNRHHWMSDTALYATSADDTVDVIVRLASAQDDAVPNANPVMMTNLVHLTLLTGDQGYAERAEAILRSVSGQVAKSPVGHAGVLSAALDLIAPQLIFVAGDASAGAVSLAAAVHSVSLPGALEYQGIDASSVPGLDGKAPANGAAAAYACLGPQCSAPTSDANALREVLKLQRSRC
jgi:uncharacterized protein